jgi:hypothetical protein
MFTVRISANWKHPDHMAWLGAPAIDRGNHIERTVDMPETAYSAIEKAVNEGHLEGELLVEGDVRFKWFLDR